MVQAFNRLGRGAAGQLQLSVPFAQPCLGSHVAITLVFELDALGKRCSLDRVGGLLCIDHRRTDCVCFAVGRRGGFQERIFRQRNAGCGELRLVGMATACATPQYEVRQERG